MLMYGDLVPILEKYWRNPIIFESELRDACSVFGKMHLFEFFIRNFFFFLIFKDKNEEGRIAFDELKAVLTKYGEQLDEDDADLILKQFNAGEGKILVEGINQHGSNIQFL